MPESVLRDGKEFPAFSTLNNTDGPVTLGPQQSAEADAGAATAAAVSGTVPAGGSGAAAGGWDTAGNRDTAITTITELKTTVNALVTDVAAIRTKLNNTLAKLRTYGAIAP